MPSTIALYTRVSTDLQLVRGSSLETQESRLRSYVRARDLPVDRIEVFREEGASGKNLERPVLQQLLARIRAGEISHLMVTRLDRLSRSLIDFFKIHDLLVEKAVHLVILNENFDTSTLMGRTVLKMLLVFAEFEREQTAERTRNAMKARAQRGLWNGGHPILGYDKHERRLIPNAGEAEVVRLVFDKYLELRSAPKLAQWLNKHGHRQKRYQSRRQGEKGGRPFTAAVVRNMLRNPVYLGKVTYKGEVFEGQHEALIESPVYDRVQSILDGNANNRRGPPSVAQHGYPLSGLLRCQCGYALTTSAGTGRNGTVYPYYRCVGVSKDNEHACELRQVRAEPVEAAVLGVIRYAATQPELVEEAVRRANELAAQHVQPLENRRASLARDLAKAEEEGKRLLGSILKAGVSDNDLARQLLGENEELRNQRRRALEEVEGELAARRTEQLDLELVRQALVTFDAVWDHLTDAERREALQLLVDRIVVSPDKVEVDLYDGGRALALLDAGAENVRTPGVNQGFVDGVKWLPRLDSNQ